MTAPEQEPQVTRLAWHFLHPNSRLRTGETAPADGVWLKHDGSIVPCGSGLHASERAIDALQYAPYGYQAVLCRVELGGEIVEHGDPVDKLAASERRILWRLDGETTDAVLREFARWAARQVLHLWDAPDIVTRFLETGDENLRTDAWTAAWTATAYATAYAARAADASAWAAAYNTWTADAAWAAAWAAVWAAVWAADASAWAAAGDAARDAQNTELERLFNAAYRERNK